MWHIQYARTYLNIPHTDNQSKTCERFKICPGTFPYLFLFTLVLEEIYVNVSTGLFGCIVEDAELRTHKETTIVEHHAVVLCTNLHPLPAIEAVKEVGDYKATIKLHKEVSVEVPFTVVSE